MTTTLAKKPRSLAKLAPMIRRELKAGFQAGERHWRNAGRLLNEARQHWTQAEPRVNGLTFHEWVQREFVHPMTGEPLTERTARRWMLGAKRSGHSGRTPVLEHYTDRRSSNHANYNPRLDWQTGVRDVQGKLNLDALKREVEDEQRQARETKALAKKIVDAGYRALAAVCHPDKPGGSTEAMAKLAAARRWLNEQINTL
jgi:hypothetical protein